MARLAGRLIREGRLELELRNGPRVELGNGRGRLHRMRFESVGGMLRILRNPGLTVGEAYMDGDWSTDTSTLDSLLGLLLDNERRYGERPLVRRVGRMRDALIRPHRLIPAVSSRRNASHHYDLGNDLYQSFLDEEMNYSCAFFTSDTDTLEQAQRNKIEITLDRADLRPGMALLDIGCGWGAVTRAAARRGAASATGITLADQQAALAIQRIPAEFADRIAYRLQDYRDHAAENPDRYDRIVSIGMFEHVGQRHFAEYFQMIERMLKPGGRAVVHSIIRWTHGPTNAWVNRYIFPGGYIPWLADMTGAARAAGLALAADPFVHEGSNYARTLAFWRDRFNANYGQLDRRRYDERFRRMWNFYLAGSQAAFEALGMGVAQLAVTKPA
ncbi:MAG: class I SAM-dependent methyltransferase [Alphaproteobacteria bacterium]